MTGFVNIIKPSGMSSARVVSAVKKKFNMPCGHMGTLDPMASGVLPVGLGKASRLFPYMLDKEKEYKAIFLFGETTDTLDVTGKITDRTDIIPTELEIKNALKNLVGEIEQIPPKYSAKCIDGKRGYQLARSGVEFELAPKKVNVLSFELLNKINDKEYEFIIKCKGGTYIRSLARDLGLLCNSLGVMKGLDRTKSGIFDYSNSVTFDEFVESDKVEKYLISADEAVSFPKLEITKRQAQYILDGVFHNYGFADGLYRVYSDGFIGVGEVIDGVLKIKSYVR